MKAIPCPECGGSGVGYTTEEVDGKLEVKEVTCPVCKGDKVIYTEDD